jgi:APA family basic amino acid/polyamine antiporter
LRNWKLRKPFDRAFGEGSGALARTLGWPHLIAMGVGAIVGTGILTLIGVGAAKAGPAVLVAFVIAGFVCACAALAYAEMATLVPASGGAYTYSYVAVGQLAAWMIGWSLILEYSLVVSAVSVGWSGYAAPLLHDWLGVPWALMNGPHAGGIVNLPAVAIIGGVAAMLIYGMRSSASVNAVLVLVKVSALVAFVWMAAPHFDSANLSPFNPFGFAKSTGADGVERGIMAAAAIIFSAFYGFDAIATAAEETRNPRRDLAIGIIGSMLACAAIYTLVAGAALGAVGFRDFADSPEPLALVLRRLGEPEAARFLALSAVVALPTVILAFFYGQSRIFFVMARDGLLPRGLARVSSSGAPVRTTLFTVLIVGTIAAFFPLNEIVALANAGTLVAFAAVAVSMLVLRRRAPDAPRGYRAPAAWLVGPVAIAGCVYLFVSLPSTTHWWFLVWNALGVALYWAYAGRARPDTDHAGEVRDG